MGAKIFKKSRRHLKILGAVKRCMKKVPYWEPKNIKTPT